jgi:hypothetical protein
MEDKDATRARVERLRVLAGLATDDRVLEQIRLLIDELERRIRQGQDG